MTETTEVETTEVAEQPKAPLRRFRLLPASAATSMQRGTNTTPET